MARITNMRGVNLNLFDFDYDLTWMSFFMNADGKVYGRYGGRDAGPADKYLTLASLKHALQAALVAYHQDPDGKPASRLDPPRTVEQCPAARGYQGCIHCHMVYEFSREAAMDTGQWRREQVWVYPPPENVGITVDRDQQDEVRTVASGSAAARGGLQPGDRLREVNRSPVVSYGDIEYALNQAPAAGDLPVTWERSGQTMSGRLPLAPGWRQTDISWRESTSGLEPTPGVYGEELSPSEKQKLGLPADRLAFREADPLTRAVREAGIRVDDIIVGVEDRPLAMNVAQFNAYMRLSYHVGDKVTFNIVRNGRRLKRSMVLAAKDTF